MTASTLRDIYFEQLQDSYSACKQSIEASNELGHAATDKALGEALVAGVNGIAQGMDQLESLCAAHGINPEAMPSKGMAGLAAEARSHALQQDFTDDTVRDAVIISQYQRMVHYAVAAYGCLQAFANRLGLDGDAATLAAMLQETRDGDRRMNAIAMGGVNAAAAS
jgi:ferritin-like metal-binding protein YciE